MCVRFEESKMADLTFKKQKISMNIKIISLEVVLKTSNLSPSKIARGKGLGTSHPSRTSIKPPSWTHSDWATKWWSICISWRQRQRMAVGMCGRYARQANSPSWVANWGDEGWPRTNRHKLSCAHRLIFIVNKGTDTLVCNLCNATTSESRQLDSFLS